METRKQALLSQVKEIADKTLSKLSERGAIIDECVRYSIVVKRVVSNPTKYTELLKIAGDIESKCLDKSKEYKNMDKLIHFEPPNENELNDSIDKIGYFTDSHRFGFPFSITDTGYGYVNVSWDTNGKILTGNDQIGIEYTYKKDGKTETISKWGNNHNMFPNIIDKHGTYSIKIRNCSTNHNFGDHVCTPYTETLTINVIEPSKDENIDVSWETNDKWKSNYIIIESNNIIKSNDGHIGSIFLSNTLNKGKYIYTFKIIKEDSDHIGFCLYNTQFGSPLLDDKLSKTKPKSSYCFNSNGYLESHHNPGNLDYSSPYQYTSNNSVIKMIIDLIEYRLSFIIDSIHYPLSFDIKKSEYKVGIYLSKLDQIQFISCKQIQ